MESVIVTGAAGFIGSHLCEALIKKGYHVIGIDDLSSGFESNLSMFKDKMDFIRGSVLEPSILDNACSLSKSIVSVFHLAAIPSVITSIENPELSHAVNINGTFNVLMAAKKHGIKRVIYSGSASAYGENPEEFKLESLCPDLKSPYGLQKWVGEKYCQYFMNFYGLETISFRYFNVFGPRQNPKSLYAAVLPIFFNNILNGLPIEIHGDGQQTRDFVYIDNVVSANLNALAAPKEACGKVYNIALGEGTSLLELIEMIEKISGKKAIKNFAPSRAGDIRHSKANITLARTFLNYNPTVRVFEGLAQMIKSVG